MPTNILRRQARRHVPARTERTPVAGREIVIGVGGVALKVRLHDTMTARLIWTALPLFSTAETWGDSIHFELPVRTGRERTARLNVSPGDICFWSEDHRVIIGWGPTPISMPHEIRLMRPCNIWATALDDVRVLDGVTPGAQVAMHSVPMRRP
jgi:uncharacterized protein